MQLRVISTDYIKNLLLLTQTVDFTQQLLAIANRQRNDIHLFHLYMLLQIGLHRNCRTLPTHAQRNYNLMLTLAHIGLRHLLIRILKGLGHFIIQFIQRSQTAGFTGTVQSNKSPRNFQHTNPYTAFLHNHLCHGPQRSHII